MGNFQKLKVWQTAKDLTVKIYRLTKKKEFINDFGFRDQIQRSALSIPSNISEGDEPGSNKQSIHYFNISKGSTAELMTQIIIGNEIGYLEKPDTEQLINQCRVVSAMLTRLINARKS